MVFFYLFIIVTFWHGLFSSYSLHLLLLLNRISQFLTITTKIKNIPTLNDNDNNEWRIYKIKSFLPTLTHCAVVYFHYSDVMLSNWIEIKLKWQGVKSSSSSSTTTTLEWGCSSSSLSSSKQKRRTFCLLLISISMLSFLCVCVCVFIMKKKWISISFYHRFSLHTCMLISIFRCNKFFFNFFF